MHPGRAVPVLVPTAFILKQYGAALLDRESCPVREVRKFSQDIPGGCRVRTQERLAIHAQGAFDGIEQVEQDGANRGSTDGVRRVCVEIVRCWQVKSFVFDSGRIHK